MNPTIDSLLKLHDLDLSLETLRRQKEALVPQKEKVEEDRRRLASDLENSKKSLAQSQLDRKKLEGEVESQEQSVRKHTGELNAVKSNDAYKALLAEIEKAKSDKQALEDKILEVMELQETLQKELKSREAEHASALAAVNARAKALDEEAARLDAALNGKSGERNGFFDGLPEDVRGPYESVRRGRSDFSVLAEVKGMICQGCRTTLPPDVVNQVLKGKALVSCDSCSRILFIRPAPSPAAPSGAPAEGSSAPVPS